MSHPPEKRFNFVALWNSLLNWYLINIDRISDIKFIHFILTKIIIAIKEKFLKMALKEICSKWNRTDRNKPTCIWSINIW